MDDTCAYRGARWEREPWTVSSSPAHGIDFTTSEADREQGSAAKKRLPYLGHGA